MTGKNVFVLQQAVDDSHVSDLVSFSWILVDDFTSVALLALLVNERPELISVVDQTVMFIQIIPAAELFLLTEAASKVRDSLSSVRFLGWLKSTRR